MTVFKRVPFPNTQHGLSYCDFHCLCGFGGMFFSNSVVAGNFTSLKRKLWLKRNILLLISVYTIHSKFTALHCSCPKVSSLASRLRGPGSSPGRRRCVVLFDKTLNSNSTSLHPVVQMGSNKFNAGGNPVMD